MGSPSHHRPVSGLASLGASPSHRLRSSAWCSVACLAVAAASPFQAGVCRLMHPHLLTVAGAVRALAGMQAAAAPGSRLTCIAPLEQHNAGHLKFPCQPHTKIRASGWYCSAVQAANCSLQATVHAEKAPSIQWHHPVYPVMVTLRPDMPKELCADGIPPSAIGSHVCTAWQRPRQPTRPASDIKASR